MKAGLNSLNPLWPETDDYRLRDESVEKNSQPIIQQCPRKSGMWNAYFHLGRLH